MAMVRKTKKVLRKKLDIPEDYRILFVSSATESWEIISQSLVRTKSPHFYNGAFGQKWFGYANALDKEAVASPFSIDEILPADTLDADADCILPQVGFCTGIHEIRLQFDD